MLEGERERPSSHLRFHSFKLPESTRDDAHARVDGQQERLATLLVTGHFT